MREPWLGASAATTRVTHYTLEKSLELLLTEPHAAGSYAILAVIVPSRCDPDYSLRDDEVRSSSTCGVLEDGDSTMWKRIALAFLLLGSVVADGCISIAPTAALAFPHNPG